jgi:hypothetical protein
LGLARLARLFSEPLEQELKKHIDNIVLDSPDSPDFYCNCSE